MGFPHHKKNILSLLSLLIITIKESALWFSVIESKNAGLTFEILIIKINYYGKSRSVLQCKTRCPSQQQ
ncbi:hypothetical protein OA93_20415 [Flavobacterium sp. KMS]|nr:hypothetical protein OA93_20415 [Flavobacterium sp. KMS]